MTSSPPRRPRQQRPHGAHFHVIYWEGGDKDGIVLEDRAQSVSRHGSTRLPYFCNQCKSVVRPWKYRLDNFQACVRAAGKEGCCFRPEAAEFVCLSPKMAIRYEFSRFYSYLSSQTSRALTERTVLGAAMQVHREEVMAEECGVSTKALPEEDEWEAWLDEYLAGVQKLAKDNGSRSVALVLDRDGVELLMLDTAEGQGHTSKLAPIERVVICLGGPSGFMKGADEDIQGRVEALLRRNLDSCVSIRLPGGLQHSNVVLADLFMANERWSLLPSVEQLIRSGPDNYTKWREVAQMLLAEMQAASALPDMGIQAMRTSMNQIAMARGKWRPAGERRAPPTERPNMWEKGAGKAGNIQPLQATQLSLPYTAAYPQLNSTLQQQQNGSGHCEPTGAHNAATAVAGSQPGVLEAPIASSSPAVVVEVTTSTIAFGDVPVDEPENLRTPALDEQWQRAAAEEQDVELNARFGLVDEQTSTGQLSEPPHLLNKSDDEGPTVAEPPASTNEAENASAQEERIDTTEPEVRRESKETTVDQAKPKKTVENGIEDPTTSTSRQWCRDIKKDDFSWAEQELSDSEKEDKEPTQADDDLKVVANAVPPEVEDSPAVDLVPDEPTCETRAPTNEQSASKVEAAPTAPTKKQWATAKTAERSQGENKTSQDSGANSERTQEAPPPLPEQEWPTLGNLGGPKRGKRK